MNLDEYTTELRTKALVYGPPKSGKTALVGKLAAAGFTLHWLDLENGIKTLLNPAILAPQYRKNINVVNIPDHRLYPVAIDTVRDIFRGGAKKICTVHGKTNCALCNKDPAAKWSTINLGAFTSTDILVIDSLSQLSQSAMNRGILKELQKPDGEEYKCTFQDYMQQGALLDQVLSMIQALNINIVVISHEIESEMTDGKDKVVPLAGTRNFSKLSAKYFDSVIYCTITNKIHRAYSSSTYAGNILTGDRFGVKLDDSKDSEMSLAPLFNRKGT